jgi:O-antigen ligase
MLPVLALTQSRGAWLALLLALLGMLALRRRAVFLAVAAGAATVVAVGGLVGVERVPGTDVLASRITLWTSSLAMLAERPLTGIGLNSFPLVFGQDPRYPDFYVYQGYAHAHNTLLQSALDYGVPGFVAVFGIYVALAWAAWRLLRRTVGTPLDALVVGLAVGLAAHAMHGMVDALAIGGKPGFIPWAAAGSLAGVRHYAHRWVPRPQVSKARSAHATPTSEGAEMRSSSE